MDFIKPGVYQYTGDNMLALINELSQSSELETNHEKSKPVYFDVFNLFMIYYDSTFAIILNMGTVILSLFSIYKTCKCLPGTLHLPYRKF